MRIEWSIIIFAFLLFGCAQQAPSQSDQPSPSIAQKCVQACEERYGAGADLSSGPCLGMIADDYVCDIAHSPRTPEDDLPANQCADFRDGRARHFVEVTPDCRLLRVA